MRKNLKAARQRTGMTQQQVADILEISLRYYGRSEAGQRNGDFIIWDEIRRHYRCLAFKEFFGRCESNHLDKKIVGRNKSQSDQKR